MSVSITTTGGSLERKGVEMKILVKPIPNSEEDAGKRMAVEMLLVMVMKHPMVGMRTEPLQMVRAGIQPRKRLTCQFSQNGASQKRYTRVDVGRDLIVLL